MSDVAASGGYYISMAARESLPKPGTLTGSIGVVGGKLAIGGLYDKIGLKTESSSAAANAGIFSSNAPFTPSERAAMTGLMKDTYEQFLIKVLEGRRIAGKPMDRAAVGYPGRRPHLDRPAGAGECLVDQLGTLQDAVAASWKLANMPADRRAGTADPAEARAAFWIRSSKASWKPLPASVQLRLQHLLPELAKPLGAAASLLQAADGAGMARGAVTLDSALDRRRANSFVFPVGRPHW